MQSEQVPVFNCIVYVSPSADGGMRARVANLPGIERTGPTEREALSKVVGAFKQCVSELLQSDTPIPWIEPIATAKLGELQRFIPVHL
jgi:predicted RNase H-like HicB family nuclease